MALEMPPEAPNLHLQDFATRNCFQKVFLILLGMGGGRSFGGYPRPTDVDGGLLFLFGHLA